MSGSFAVIIPAAGTGSRSGRDLPKQYVELLGSPVLRHTLRAFAGAEGCRGIIVAIDEAWEETARRCARGLENVRFIPGGTERQHSIANALGLIGERDAELVLVHDAARPCISRELIGRVLDAAGRYGAAVPALAINETVKRVGAGGIILETVPRAELRAAQTPQGFRRELLIRAYAHALETGFVGTDDASLVEALGEEVRVVDGEPGNIKITLPDDFERAERTLAKLNGTGEIAR